METCILGISGKKQSGKSTLSNYIMGLWFEALGICKEAKITEKGELFVSDVFGTTESGIVDTGFNSPNKQAFAQEHVYPFIKIYSFADLLKQSICIDILGLDYEQCYGTDNQKQTLTHLKWEDMPCVVTEILPEVDEQDYEEIAGRIGPYYKELLDGTIYHKKGNMTGREVMQFVGTEVFRKMYDNVWVDSTIKRIKLDSPCMALICDVRFENEANGILSNGGKLIRLTRDINNGKDQHASETGLDNYTSFSCLIDNQDKSIYDTHQLAHEYLKGCGWTPHKVPEQLYGENK